MLRVGESALYPALQRLLFNGWVKAEWGTSENNRRARYYTLTAAGRKQLAAERAEFDRMIGAIQRVLRDDLRGDAMNTLFRRLLHFLRWSRHDADLREEIETHRSLRQDALRA